MNNRQFSNCLKCCELKGECLPCSMSDETFLKELNHQWKELYLTPNIPFKICKKCELPESYTYFFYEDSGYTYRNRKIKCTSIFAKDKPGMKKHIIPCFISDEEFDIKQIIE